VLGPLLFLIFINDITKNTSSTARLFVDDCLLYRTINCEADAITLQKDLDPMQQCTVPWGIPDVIADLEDLKIYDNFITSRKFKLL
jgi:hypothetical protein